MDAPTPRHTTALTLRHTKAHHGTAYRAGEAVVFVIFSDGAENSSREFSQAYTALHGTARHGTARHGTARHVMACHGMAWHGMSWHDMT